LAPLAPAPLEKLPHVRRAKHPSFFEAAELTARLLLVSNPNERPDAKRANDLAEHLATQATSDWNPAEP